MVETSRAPANHVGAGGARFFDKGGETVPLPPDMIYEIAEGEGVELRNDHVGFVDYVPMGSLAKGRTVAMGNKGAMRTCGSCHGDDYRGHDEAPRLAGRSAYSATKAGIIGLGRAWALELAPFGITVNMVAPGPIGDTPMFEALVPKGSETEARIAAGIPVGRLGRPSDVANAVRFFAGDAADFITGQVLYVCGGASVGTAPL